MSANMHDIACVYQKNVTDKNVILHKALVPNDNVKLNFP